MKIVITLCCGLLAFGLAAQAKKPLDHPDFAIWNQIQQTRISANGQWISYQVVPGEGDQTLNVYHVNTQQTQKFFRGKNAAFTDDNAYVVFTISPPEDSVKAMRRKKVEKEKLPTDTLAILHLTSGNLVKIPDLEKVIVPDRWAGHIAYQVKPALTKKKEEEVEKEEKKEEGEKKEKKKEKEPSAKNGWHLIIHELATGNEDTLRFVTDVSTSKYGKVFAAHSTGQDSTPGAGVYVYPVAQSKWSQVKAAKGKYKQLTWNEQGTQLAFLGDVDTTKAQIRPFDLYRWIAGKDSAEVLVRSNAGFMPEDWIVSEHYPMKFSADGKRLHFGSAPKAIPEDTTLLDEEKVSVEVWHYMDERMYTQQNVRAKSEKERGYHCIADLSTMKFRQVANEHVEESRMDRDGNSPVVVLFDESPYLRAMSWLGGTSRDVWTYDVSTGHLHSLAKGISGTPQLSPQFQYVYWYHLPDSAWYVSPVKGQPVNVSRNIPVSVSDELNDVPDYPDPYGVAGWVNGDSTLLIYDRFDIWKVDPKGQKTPMNLTNGRSAQLRYRYIRLDPDEKFIDPALPVLLSVFDEETKASGYAELNLLTGTVKSLVHDPMKFDASPVKARDANLIVYTKESYQVFPDLQVTTDRFAHSTKISEANPQQKDYGWGTIELFTWTSYDGQELTGLLVKPADFDPSKKYPMIVQFYDRSSDELHNHRTPFPHRSTINYPFYASRGYVIFNPDIPYRIGYPGESAFNAVVSGTQAVIAKGFVNPQKVGLQGHSWGGYQVAHILTKTGIYACAEAGAVVVNMTSAYGGIRWETGLSRMFQYEHQQSRLGGTLWEKPNLYLENSPLFNLDKISTPVLIVQNDSDGHVPWYQGIEFFSAMRRLNKPAWMLNYNGEPHWPVKLQNRKDFNIRMQQFFDHYLKDAPMPKWMRDGVPAVEKGVLQGYELLEGN